jgi:Domain of unknown function (DUF4251)
MKALMKFSLIFAAVIGGFSISHAQNTRKEKQAAKVAAVKKMVEDGNYVFEANFAYPQGGAQKTLTSDYDLRVSKDSVIAFLPYYGVAYLSPNPSDTEGGIKFTSTSFNYTTTQRKNGTWDVSIKPKDNNITGWRDVQQLQLSISQSGYASLQVISSNRSPIQFDGEITQKTKM